MPISSTKINLPPLPYKSAIRKMIEIWANGQQLSNIVRLGMGHGYMVPSRSEPGSFYVVFHREEDDTWACSCKGFRFNKKRDSCFHVEQIIEKEKEASKKWKGPASKSSSTTTGRKKSSTATAVSGSTRKSSQKARPTKTSQSSAGRSPAARSSSRSSNRAGGRH